MKPKNQANCSFTESMIKAGSRKSSTVKVCTVRHSRQHPQSLFGLKLDSSQVFVYGNTTVLNGITLATVLTLLAVGHHVSEVQTVLVTNLVAASAC